MTFFGLEILVRTFLGVDKKRNPGFSIVLYSNNCIVFIYQRKVDAKTVWNSLELLLLFFLIGLFLGYVLGRWTFFGPGSSLKDCFLGLTISPHSHIPVTNIPEYLYRCP